MRSRVPRTQDRRRLSVESRSVSVREVVCGHRLATWGLPRLTRCLDSPGPRDNPSDLRGECQVVMSARLKFRGCEQARGRQITDQGSRPRSATSLRTKGFLSESDRWTSKSIGGLAKANDRADAYNGLHSTLNSRAYTRFSGPTFVRHVPHLQRLTRLENLYRLSDRCSCAGTLVPVRFNYFIDVHARDRQGGLIRKRNRVARMRRRIRVGRLHSCRSNPCDIDRVATQSERTSFFDMRSSTRGRATENCIACELRDGEAIRIHAASIRILPLASNQPAAERLQR